MSELPESIREMVDQQERTARSLERASAPPGEPEPQTSAEAFTARMAAQRRAEDERERLERQALFQHPEARLDEADPLRELARQQARKRRRRHRSM